MRHREALARLRPGCVALVAGRGAAEAQQYFGQNQVQYDQFEWKVIETEHFLVHYYPEERDGIMDAARMAERSYARLSRMLKHQFREKKPLILYSLARRLRAEQRHRRPRRRRRAA